MSGSRSRRKGQGWERELCRRFRDLGVPCERTLTECRDGNVGDLDLPAWVPLRVQAKVGASPAPWSALREARTASGPGLRPVALLKRSGAGSRPSEEVAVLPLDDFFELVRLLLASGTWKDDG